MGTQPPRSQPSIHHQINAPKSSTTTHPTQAQPSINHQINAPKSSTSSSSSSSLNKYKIRNFNYQNNNKRGIRVLNNRGRNPKFFFRRNSTDVDALAFPLGMSIAAVLTQVLERTELTNEKISIDQLSTICTSAVRESLSNVFGDKFNAFTKNFEKSFGSTLSTLCTVRSIRNSSANKGQDQVGDNHIDDRNIQPTPTFLLDKGECSSGNCDVTDCNGESMNRLFETGEHRDKIEEVEDNHLFDSRNLELSMQRHKSQDLSTSVSDKQSYSSNLTIVSSIEKSVIEQTRANDLKSVEIGLIMRKLQLKEKQLSLNSDLNFLERCKLSLGHARTSFKAEKFKTQLEETRHSELLRTCADLLVADLLIMLFSMGYGVYAFSYDRIHDLTKSCSSPPESKSWWIPKPMSSFNSGLKSLNCQVQVYSRMLFGAFMILSITYVLIQRASISTAAMPITLMVLLLGGGCGFVGKFCVDTLGGDGNKWLIYWEVLCFLHFFANVFTPYLVHVLSGPVQVTEQTIRRSLFPYRVRRWLFYLTLLVIPFCCGLFPFASPRKWWDDHFSKLIKNHLLAINGENFDDGEGDSGLHE